MRFDPHTVSFEAHGIVLRSPLPLVDGELAPVIASEVGPQGLSWTLGGRCAGACMTLRIAQSAPGLRLDLALTGLSVPDIDSIGLRFDAVDGVERYLRNGYQSWDGSYLAIPGAPAADPHPGRAPDVGYGCTALLPRAGGGCLLLAFTRADRFQVRFRFAGDPAQLRLDAETLWDRVPHHGTVSAEPLALYWAAALEEGLAAWSRQLAQATPTPPRLPGRRLTGWCSWYNLYAAIDEAVLREHLNAAAAFRDEHRVPLEIFQIDDGFTPEMGDWLEVKPQFPRGMAPLLREIRAAGFTPGLWIAPFMVGNRSRLFQEHPDWVVRDRRTGSALSHMAFYGEFRWHKRSEEYYILDITHPGAEAYIRRVLRTWRHDWGAGYFKTDFMLFGSEYGPDRAQWHTPGLSRIAIWRKMGRLIREEIGEALWLGCGCPLWASVGLVDAIRIGRDIGVSWKGDYSAESLLRDQVTRNHGNGILWQADPDCILLRSRFHELNDDQVRSLALFAGLAGGVLMTSDKLDELSPQRAALFAALLREPSLRAGFPQLTGHAASGVIVQDAVRPDGSAVRNLFNTRATPAIFEDAQLSPYHSHLLAADRDPLSGAIDAC
jgi:alpha-galactosidase